MKATQFAVIAMIVMAFLVMPAMASDSDNDMSGVTTGVNVTSSTIGKEADKIVITNATHGMTKTVIDRIGVEGTPAVPEGTQVICHPEVPAVYIRDYTVGHVHAVKVQENYYGNLSYFLFGDFYYKIVDDEQARAFMKYPDGGNHYGRLTQADPILITPRIPAYCERIVVTPAIQEVPSVTELSHVEGSYADVTNGGSTSSGRWR